ncbi:MAG: hypothetical protein ACI84C_001027, partial [Flavobacteriales bacterium]
GLLRMLRAFEIRSGMRSYTALIISMSNAIMLGLLPVPLV